MKNQQLSPGSIQAWTQIQAACRLIDEAGAHFSALHKCATEQDSREMNKDYILRMSQVLADFASSLDGFIDRMQVMEDEIYGEDEIGCKRLMAEFDLKGTNQ